MVVKHHQDPVAFLDAAGSLLLEDEARNNLILGIAGTLRDHPHVYPERHLWLVQDNDRVVGAALQTPPYNLVLGRPRGDRPLTALADALESGGAKLPGATGALPEVDVFAEAWEARTAVVRQRRMSQRIYRLTELRTIQGVPGHARAATHDDRSLLLAWVKAFAAEVAPEDTPGRGVERTIDARVREGAGGFTIWEDAAEPVSLAGWGGATPNGVRIGPVYTPPEHRRRGYASAVTAAVSSERLASGRQFCVLYTDLANPTSNRIYMNIGYEPVCDSVDYAFETA